MNDVERRRQAWVELQRAHEAQGQGNLKQAIQLYQRSLESYPTAEAYTFLGWSFSYQGDLDRAISTCLQAVELDPEYGNPYNDIGAYLIEQGRLDEAIPWLEKALQAPRYDSYCFPWVNLGRIRERKGDFHRAMECYKEALRCNGTYAVAAKGLSRLRGMLN